MLTVEAFAERYPEYALKFDGLIKDQTRIYNAIELSLLPQELLPTQPYIAGSFTKPNRNQTIVNPE